MKNPLPQLILVSFFLIIYQVAFSQDPPVFSQFQQNPFQFNPSYAAYNGYSEANVFYRKQFLGIDNAPEVLAFNIHAPLGRNVAIGLTAYSSKTVLLTTNSALLTFGYRVRFGYDHHLNFGLSGGMGFNTFDMEAVANSPDPALTNVAQNSSFLGGQFGINYRFKNFSLGFALPKLFESTPTGLEEFNEIEFNPFTNKFGSVSYTFNLGNINLTPSVIYRAIENQQDQWEGMLIANYKNIFWLGSSYRDGYGLTGFIGINIKKMLRIGYAYEVPTGSISKASTGTHEVYLGGRLSKQNREDKIFAQQQKRDSAELAKKQNEEKALAQEEKPQETVAPIVVAPVVIAPKAEEKVIEKEPVVTTPVVKQPQTPPTTAKPTDELNVGYYLVLGVYRNVENALKQMGYLKGKGHTPSIIYISDKEFYYVYVFHSTVRQETVNELNKIRQQNQYFGAWMFTVQ